MSHTTASASDVQDLLETDLTIADITPFLSAAERFVTDNLEGQGVADATMTEIEKYLAAHLVTLKDPRLTRASIGDVSETYQRDAEVSEYLRVAIALDPSDAIEAEFGERRSVSFRVGRGYDSDLDLPASP